MPVQSSTHLTAIKTLVENALQTAFPTAEVYKNNLPPDRGEKKLLVAVRQIGGPYDSRTNVKTVPFQVIVVGISDEDCSLALDEIFDALRDVEVASTEAGAGVKLVVSASTTPNYDGTDEANMPVYSCNFELVTIH